MLVVIGSAMRTTDECPQVGGWGREVTGGGRAGSAQPPRYDQRMDAILGDCTLDKLRRRKSFKWRAYPDDVLPAFIAEMDFDLAEPVKEAVTAAMADGDCGYADKGELGDAFAAFAAARLGWSPDPGLVYPIPDVMTGIAEVLMALTPPGAGVVINPPVYPPFFFRLAMMGRKLVDAPLRRPSRRGFPLRPRSRSTRPGPIGRRRRRLPAVQPAQPGRPGLVPRRAADRGRHLRAARHRADRGRDPRAPGPARRAAGAVPVARPRADRAGDHLYLGLQGLEHSRPQVRHRRRRVDGDRHHPAGPVGRAAGLAPRRAGRGRRVHQRAPVARRDARPDRREPRAAGAPARQAPARRRLRPAGGKLPGLARLPAARARR